MNKPSAFGIMDVFHLNFLSKKSLTNRSNNTRHHFSRIFARKDFDFFLIGCIFDSRYYVLALAAKPLEKSTETQRARERWQNKMHPSGCFQDQELYRVINGILKVDFPISKASDYCEISNGRFQKIYVFFNPFFKLFFYSRVK